MPASNFPFRAPYGCKLQEVTHDVNGVQTKESWLVVEPNTEEGLSDKQKPYCFMADAETREASIFFNFACGKVVGDDLYLLASVNGESQAAFEIKIQKKENDKYVEDVEKTKEFYTKWKETGYLVAFHVNGIWNLELLVKVISDEKVLLKDAVKCLFSKKEVPLELLAKVSDQYKAAVSHLKTGLTPRQAEPDIFEKLKALNTSMGLPTLVLKEAELEDDFGDYLPCPKFDGELPDNVVGLFSPKAATPYQKKEQKTYGMQPEQRMEFLFTNFDNPKVEEYITKVFNHPHGYMKHLVLCQITGLDVGFPSGLVSTAVHPLYMNNGQKNGHQIIEKTSVSESEDVLPEQEVQVTENLPATQTLSFDNVEVLSKTVTDVEEVFDWDEYVNSAGFPAKEQKKIKECLDYVLSQTFLDFKLYVSSMEMDGSTKLKLSRQQPEVKKYVCSTLVNLYKVLSSETLQKNMLQLPSYLLHHFNLSSIEYLDFAQLKQLQAKLSELDKRASIEEVSLSV